MVVGDGGGRGVEEEVLVKEGGAGEDDGALEVGGKGGDGMCEVGWRVDVVMGRDDRVEADGTGGDDGRCAGGLRPLVAWARRLLMSRWISWYC